MAAHPAPTKKSRPLGAASLRELGELSMRVDHAEVSVRVARTRGVKQLVRPAIQSSSTSELNTPESIDGDCLSCRVLLERSSATDA